MKLTPAQERAVAVLDDPAHTTGGVLYAFNGVSRPTAARLVEEDLAEWAPEPRVTRHRRPMGWRTRSQVEWGIQKKANQG